MRNSTVHVALLAFIIAPVTVTAAAGESVERIKQIVSESGRSRPVNKANWEEEFLANLPGPLSNKPVSVQAWTNINEIATRLLKKDGSDNQITRERLGANLKNASLSSTEAQVNAALYDNFAKIKKLDTNSKHGETLTARDISNLCRTGLAADAGMATVDDLTYWADDQKNLQRFSKDGHGNVSLADLKNAEKGSGISSTDRAMLAQLETQFAVIAKDGTIGKSQIDSYFSNYRHSDPQYRLASAFIRDMHYVSLAQQNPEERLLFKNQKSPLQDITADAVMQGRGADCAFKAALISFAQNQPAKLLATMRKIPDGVAVKFADTKETIDVPPLSAQEIGLFGGESAHGFWPTVLENAYGQKVSRSLKSSSLRAQQNLNNSEKASLDGYPADAVKALTGHKTEIKGLGSLREEQIGRLLQQAQADHRVVVMATSAGDDTKKTKDGFSFAHGYAFVGIDNSGTVTLRDPRSLPPAGMDKLSLAALKANFSYMAVESNESL